MTPYDPTDTHAQALARSQHDDSQRLARERESDDLRWLMMHARGRRVVWRWLERAGIWRLSFDSDALAMAFNEGSRNQGLMLLNLLLASCPTLYTTMMEEAHDEPNPNQ